MRQYFILGYVLSVRNRKDIMADKSNGKSDVKSLYTLLTTFTFLRCSSYCPPTPTKPISSIVKSLVSFTSAVRSSWQYCFSKVFNQFNCSKNCYYATNKGNLQTTHVNGVKFKESSLVGLLFRKLRSTRFRDPTFSTFLRDVVGSRIPAPFLLSVNFTLQKHHKTPRIK